MGHMPATLSVMTRGQPKDFGRFTVFLVRRAYFHVEKTFKEAVDSMVRVRDLALKERVNGMLYWTYDSFEQPRLYPAASDWALFVRKMGSFEQIEESDGSMR